MELWPLVFLALSGFVAGFIDAVVGGGGLIQLPALLGALTQTSIATIFGTNKLASIFGTSGAAIHYARRVALPWQLLPRLALSAFVMSYLGAKTVSLLPSHSLRPLILVLLGVMTIYTYRQKDFGNHQLSRRRIERKKEGLIALFIGSSIGFYDGFFGPGTGSFLVFALIWLLGFDFLLASAVAKVVNASTNLAALIYFFPHRHVWVELGLVLGVFNMAGSLVGANLAVHLGTGFVRRVFLLVSSALILKFAWDIAK